MNPQPYTSRDVLLRMRKLAKLRKQAANLASGFQVEMADRLMETNRRMYHTARQWESENT